MQTLSRYTSVPAMLDTLLNRQLVLVDRRVAQIVPVGDRGPSPFRKAPSISFRARIPRGRARLRRACLSHCHRSADPARLRNERIFK